MVTIACPLLNKSAIIAIVDKIPMEVWTGNKPSLYYLCVFGCEAYALLPKEKPSKLDNKAINVSSFTMLVFGCKSFV